MNDQIVADLHLSADRSCPGGEIHILCAAREYEFMRTFLAKHFDTWEYGRDEYGKPTFIKYKVVIE